MNQTSGNTAATPPAGKSRCETYREDLMRYVDGELQGADLDRFEAHLAECTECTREVTVFRSLKGELRNMGLQEPEIPGGSVWEDVNRSVARPTGWIFLVIGAVLYAAYATFTFITSSIDLFEKLAVGFIVIGFVVLLATVAYERIVDYRTDPYKGVEK